MYQIGLILSEALSGVPCVEGHSSVQLILAHCSGEVNLAPAVIESDFGRVVLKATAFEASDRYRDGGEFAAALSQVDATTLEHAVGMVRPGEVVTAQLLFETVDDAPSDEMVPTRKMQAIAEPTVTIDAPKDAAVVRTEVRAPDRLGWPWYLAGVGAVALIVGLIFANRPVDAPPPEIGEPIASIAVAEVPAEPVLEAREFAPAEDLGGLVLQPRFTISTQPIGAAVYRGMERLGRTPVVLRGDVIDDSEIELRIELEGHKSQTETVALIDGGRLDIELEPTREATAIREIRDQDFQPGNVFEMIEFSRKLNEEHGAGESGVVTPHQLILQRQKQAHE